MKGNFGNSLLNYKIYSTNPHFCSVYRVFLYEVKHSVKLFKSFFKFYTSYDFDYCLNISLLGSICCIPNPSLFEPID